MDIVFEPAGRVQNENRKILMISLGVEVPGSPSKIFNWTARSPPGPVGLWVPVRGKIATVRRPRNCSPATTLSIRI